MVTSLKSSPWSSATARTKCAETLFSIQRKYLRKNKMKNIKAFVLGAGVVMAMLASCSSGSLTESGLDPAKF